MKNRESLFKLSEVKFKLLLIFCFFPFLKLLGFETDSQPNALILCLIVILFRKEIRFPKEMLVLFFLSLLSIAVIVISKLNGQSFVSVMGYLSLSIVPFCAVILLKRGGLTYTFFKNAVYVWGIVAVIQKLIYPSFLTFLLPRSTGGALNGRGVTSLAPEPTYYGTVVALLMVVYLLNFWERDRKIFYILIIQLVVLSVSSTMILVLLASLCLFFIVGFFRIKLTNKLLILASLFFIIFLGYSMKNYWSETRLYKITEILADNPALILKDESINERINHVYFPIVSLIKNFGLPNGYGNFQDYIKEQLKNPEYFILFENINIGHYVKVMSGYGMIFYELGIFGVLLPLLILYVARKSLGKPNILFAYILFNLILFTAISLSNALVLFIIGNFIYLNGRRIKSIQGTQNCPVKVS